MHIYRKIYFYSFAMKRLFLLLLWFLSFGLVSASTWSVDPMNLPKITEYVTDFSSVLTQGQKVELSLLADNYYQQTSNQLVAIVIPNRNNYELFDIGMKAFSDNQIGTAGKNNGLLLVISSEEKKIRIVVGYGLEWVIPDALASKIIEEDIRPLVNNWDIAGAIRAFYTRSIAIIADPNEWSDVSNDVVWSAKTKWDDSLFWGLLLWWFLWSRLRSWRKKYANKEKSSGRNLMFFWWILLFALFFAGFSSFTLVFLASFFWGTSLWLFLGFIGLFWLLMSLRGWGFWGGGGFWWWFWWWGFSWWWGSSWGGGAGD